MHATNLSVLCQYLELHGFLRHQNAMKTETVIYHLTVSCCWQTHGCCRPDADGVDRGIPADYSYATSSLHDMPRGVCFYRVIQPQAVANVLEEIKIT